MKKRTFLLLGLVACVTMLIPMNVLAQEKSRAVIIDGQNNHNWSGTTPYLKKILEISGKFDVDVATSPAAGGDMENFNVDFQN